MFHMINITNKMNILWLLHHYLIRILQADSEAVGVGRPPGAGAGWWRHRINIMKCDTHNVISIFESLNYIYIYCYNKKPCLSAEKSWKQNFVTDLNLNTSELLVNIILHPVSHVLIC